MNEAGDPKAALSTALGKRHVTMISLGGIIGAGLFVGSGSAIKAAGPAVILVYGGCGFLVYLIMRMLAEMAASALTAGSFAAYIGKALGPGAGSMARWLFLYFWIFVVGAETVAGAKLMQSAGVPGTVLELSAIILFVMTVFNLVSVRAYGNVEFAFAFVKVAAIVVFICVAGGFLVLFEHGAPTVLAAGLGAGGFMPNGVSGLLAAVPIVIFSMVGSEVATIAAAESSDPAGNIARAGRTVALRILTFYVLSVGLILMITPWANIVPGTSPFVGALNRIGIPFTGVAMNIVVITAVLSCLNSGIYITSRMLFELAKTDGAPSFLGYVNRKKVPVFGVLVGLAAGALAAFAQLYMSQDIFTLLASTSGDLILFVYLMIALSQIVARRTLARNGLPVRNATFLFPYLSYFVVLAIAGILVCLFIDPSQRLTLLLSIVPTVLVGTVLLLKNRFAARAQAPLQPTCAS